MVNDENRTEQQVHRMRASVVTHYGGPEVLEWRSVPKPSPGPGQVRIAVRAAGISPSDPHIRAGHLQEVFPLPDPAVLGFEVAGVVDAVGEGARGVSVGDEVAARLPGLGGYAEFAVADAWTAKPAHVGWEAAASLPTAAEAAVAALRQLRVRDGSRLLVLGATGSVGMVAVQVAARLGATVVGSAPERDRPRVEAMGARFLSSEASPAAGLDALGLTIDGVLDAVSVGGLEPVIAAVGSPSKIVALTGASARDGVQMLAEGVDRAADALEITMPMLAAGTLQLRAHESFPMAEAARAHAVLEARTSRRKLLLVV